ncbi:MAG: 4Fe-4S dicluster domain-containing protein [Candidatus Limnocylindrales bacterium]
MRGSEPAFSPLPLGVLLRRTAHEWRTRRAIFDLAPGHFFDASAGPDLSVRFLGRPAATPLGPAAGPHTQLAQNLVLGWLGGARIFELKTVQALDRLEVPRPCIDMATVGYNVEWSQELRLEQSLEEYVKAAMIIEILGGWDELRPFLGPDPASRIFDLSVGYDLDGIASPRVAAFIDGLVDARQTIDRLRAEIPEPFAAWRGHVFPAAVAGSATLSTFHGCPPAEIGAIARHLMTRHGLDVVVKLNPTLLGLERVSAILRGRLGYEEIQLRPEAFEADLTLRGAVSLIGELDAFAREHGLRFGIKLTNTLVVANHRGVLPADPMYLSGPPLHVLAVTLLDELSRALPGSLAVGRGGGSVEVSFSAGVTKHNVADVAGLGVTPISVCSDLLHPGGYGRLKPMLTTLRERMAAAGCADLAAWRWHQQDEAVAAGADDAVAAYARSLGTEEGARPYAWSTTARPHRHVDRVLARWDCVACNECVTVCPNDAFFRMAAGSEAGLSSEHQYVYLAELCNRCGNCAVFCPEEGDPAGVKPALFLDPARFAADDRPGFLLTREGERVLAVPSPGLEADAERLGRLLDAPGGLPIDPRDLAAVAGSAP